MLAATQAWALPTDSLPMGRHGLQLNTLQKKDWQPIDSILKPIIIEPTITVNPKSLDFGTVPIGRSLTLTFTVRGLMLKSNLTLRVLTSRSSTSDGFTIDKTTITPAQARWGVTVRVTFKPEYVGTFTTTSVYISGGGAEPQVVPLTGTCVESVQPPVIEPSITVTPTSLDFGTVMLGQSVSKTFKVKGSNLTGPLTLRVLTSRSSASDGFSINKTTITPREALFGATVTVTYKPEYVGTQNSTSVYISGGGIETQEVALTGTCVERDTPPDVLKPTIIVNPSSLDFGTVLYGMSATKTFTVRGLLLTGNLTLDVLTTRSGSSDGFAINRTTITPSQAMNGITVAVTYRPLYEGTQNSTFVRISGGGADPQEVALTGTCVGANHSMTPSLDDADSNTISLEPMGNATTSVDERTSDIHISAQGCDIIIDSAVDQSAIISDIAGHARRVNLKAGRNVIPAGTSGLYIVRVGNNTAKLLMK